MWASLSASRRSSSGLRSQGAIRSAIAPAHGAPRSQSRPSPKKAGTSASCSCSRPAMKSSIAVSTPLPGPPSRLAAHGKTQPCPRQTGFPRGNQRVARKRLPMLLGDPLRRVVGVAAGMRPADVVEGDQGQRCPSRPLGDQPQLLADRVVVVIAVDDQRVGRRQAPQRLQARLSRELQLGVRVAQLEQLRRRLGLDRGHLHSGVRRPAEQHPGQLPAEGADLDHGGGRGGREAGKQEASMARQRVLRRGVVGRAGRVHRAKSPCRAGLILTAARGGVSVRPCGRRSRLSGGRPRATRSQESKP